MQDEIDFFLEEKEYESEAGADEEHEHTDTSNPFVALVGGYENKESAGKPEKKEKAAKENWWPAKESYIEEKVLRPFAEEQAREQAFKIFDVYKKAHGMPSYT